VAILGGDLALEVEGDECQVREAPAAVTVVNEPAPSTV
jgi:hypothetical protein